MPEIHPTAIVDDGADIAAGVVIGPYCVVGPDVERPHASATAVVKGSAVFLPLADLIDLGDEEKRIGKEIAQLGKYVASTQKKLGNANFVSRAPEEVVAAEREKVATAEASLERLRNTLESIRE